MANAQEAAYGQAATGTVVGYFDDASQAEKAVSALRDAGFTSSQIGFAGQAGQPLPTSETETDAARLGTVRGTEHEGVWDKIKGFFGADPVEPYADEKRDGDLATREVTADPSYSSEDFHGTLTEMSVPADRSRYFGHRFGSSDQGTLVTVTAPGRESEAANILTSKGADLGESAATYDYASNPSRTATGMPGTSAAASSTTSSGTQERAAGTQNIQLLGEALRVHKDRVSRGDVTLRKEVTTETKTIQVPVSREELVIERRAAADGTTPSGSIGEGSEIRIPLSEERASTDKSTFVREEVAVGKRSVDDTREVSGEVRREDLVVDDQTKGRRTEAVDHLR